MGAAHPTGRHYTVARTERHGMADHGTRRCMAHRISRQSHISKVIVTPSRRRRQGLEVICEESVHDARSVRRCRQLIPRARLLHRSFRDEVNYPLYTLQNGSRSSSVFGKHCEDAKETNTADNTSLCEEVFLEVPPEFRDDSESGSMTTLLPAHGECRTPSPVRVSSPSTCRPSSEVNRNTVGTNFNNAKEVGSVRHRKCAEQLNNELDSHVDKYYYGVINSEKNCRNDANESQVKLAKLCLTTHLCKGVDIPKHVSSRKYGTFSKKTLISCKADIGIHETEQEKDALDYLNGCWTGTVSKESPEWGNYKQSNTINIEITKSPNDVKECTRFSFPDSPLGSHKTDPSVIDIKRSNKGTFKKNSAFRLASASCNLSSKHHHVTGRLTDRRITTDPDRAIGGKIKRPKSDESDNSGLAEINRTTIHCLNEKSHLDVHHSNKVADPRTVMREPCIQTSRTEKDSVKEKDVCLHEALNNFKNISAHTTSSVRVCNENALSYKESLSDAERNNKLPHFKSKQDKLTVDHCNTLASNDIANSISDLDNLSTVNVSRFDTHLLSTNKKNTYNKESCELSCKDRNTVNTLKSNQVDTLNNSNKSITNIHLDSQTKNVKLNTEEKHLSKSNSTRANWNDTRVLEKFTVHKQDQGFCGLLQYLHDNKRGLSEILAKNNVIIEPLHEESNKLQQNSDEDMSTNSSSRASESEKTCRITGATIKEAAKNTEKLTSSSTNSLPKHHSQRPVLRRHYFYYPTRTNRELVDEELPDPDKVKITRQLFENCAFANQVSLSDGSKQQDKSDVKCHKIRRGKGFGDLYCTWKSMHRSATLGDINSEFAEARQTSIGNLSKTCEDLRSYKDENYKPKLITNTCINDKDDEITSSHTIAETEEKYVRKFSDDDIDESGRYITSDVLEKIRACGTSVTYYGGHVISCNKGNFMNPMTTAIMDEIRQNDSAGKDADEQGFVLKFRLVKSNSCGSRIELAGAEEHNKCILESKGRFGKHQGEFNSFSKQFESLPKTEMDIPEKHLMPLDNLIKCRDVIITNSTSIPLHENKAFENVEDNSGTKTLRESHENHNTNPFQVSKTFFEDKYDFQKWDMANDTNNTHLALLNKSVSKSHAFNDMEFEEFEILEENSGSKCDTSNEKGINTEFENISLSPDITFINDKTRKCDNHRASDDCVYHDSAKDDLNSGKPGVHLTTWASQKRSKAIEFH